MNLIHEHVRHAGECGFGREPSEEHAGGAKEQPGAFGPLRLESNLVPHRFAEVLAALLRHARGDGYRGYPPGLRAQYAGHRRVTARQRALKHELRQLRSFPAAGFAGHDQHLGSVHRREELIALVERGEARARGLRGDDARGGASFGLGFRDGRVHGGVPRERGVSVSGAFAFVVRVAPLSLRGRVREAV